MIWAGKFEMRAIPQYYSFGVQSFFSEVRIQPKPLTLNMDTVRCMYFIH